MTASPLLHLPGAVASVGLDEGVAAHYGDPFGEQRALAERAGWVDRSHRFVLTVTGPDRLSWLNDLLTRRLSDLMPGEGRDALLLDPNGRVENHVVALDDESTTWLDGEPGHGSSMGGFLERMRFLLRVEVVDASAEWALLTVAGPELAELDLASELPAARWIRPRRWPASAYDVCVPREGLAASAAALNDAGIVPAGILAYEALRVAAGEPRLGLDTDDRTIPNETTWLRTAVDLDKGCYRGQETVARVHAMGRPPRRLVLAHLAGIAEELPPPGTPVQLTDRQVGQVRSAVRHYELGQLTLLMMRRADVGVAGLVVRPVDGSPESVAVDPDWIVPEESPGEGAGRRAQQGLRDTAKRS